MTQELITALTTSMQYPFSFRDGKWAWTLWAPFPSGYRVVTYKYVNPFTSVERMAEEK